jgi:hypothetical protein
MVVKLVAQIYLNRLIIIGSWIDFDQVYKREEFLFRQFKFVCLILVFNIRLV